MGWKFNIDNDRVCDWPLHVRLDAIQIVMEEAKGTENPRNPKSIQKQ